MCVLNVDLYGNDWYGILQYYCLKPQKLCIIHLGQRGQLFEPHLSTSAVLKKGKRTGFLISAKILGRSSTINEPCLLKSK